MQYDLEYSRISVLSSAFPMWMMLNDRPNMRKTVYKGALYSVMMAMLSTIKMATHTRCQDLEAQSLMNMPAMIIAIPHTPIGVMISPKATAPAMSETNGTQ